MMNTEKHMDNGNKERHNLIPIIVMAAVVIAFIGLGISYGLGSSGVKATLTVKTYEYFDTVSEVSVYDNLSKEKKAELEKLIDERLKYYHELFDIYHTYEGLNNIKTVNDNAGLNAVKVPEELYNLLSFGIVMSEQTGGKVNIAMGNLISVWNEYREQGESIPPIRTLLKNAENADVKYIYMKEDEKSVFLVKENMSIDLGAVGKGYAAELLAEDLEEFGIKNALIALGGNIVALGDKSGELYTVGIEDPEREDQVKVTLKISDLSVVTSGDYQRYYEVDGKRYCHIIDPDTMFPAEYYRSVTVIAKSSALADALSTALFNMEYEKGSALIYGFDGVEAMWVLQDGTVQYSRNFEQYIK